MDGPAEAGFGRGQARHVLLQGHALFHRKRADIDFEGLEFSCIELRGRFGQKVVELREFFSLDIDFIAVLAGETGAVDADGQIADLVVRHAEPLHVVDGGLQHAVQHVEGFRALDRVHADDFGEVFPLDVLALRILLQQRLELRSVQSGDPVNVFCHAGDDGIVEDLALIVQHGGVLGHANGIGDVVDANIVEQFMGIGAADFDEVVGPAVPADVLADRFGVRSCCFIFSE